MITIITERPERSIDVMGYGIDSYVDKSGNKIWKVYGIVSPMQRGRLVSRDSSVIKDLYIDEETICIYRSTDEDEVRMCKQCIDINVTHNVGFFSVYAFQEMMKKRKQQGTPVITDDDIEDGVIINAD